MYNLLIFILFFKLINANIVDLVLDFFNNQPELCDSKWNRLNFLVGKENSTVLFFDDQSIYKFNYRKNRIIQQFPNFLSERDKKRTKFSYLNGCLIKNYSLYLIIYKESISEFLFDEQFENNSFSELLKDVSFKDNPRLFYSTDDKNVYNLMISSSNPLRFDSLIALHKNQTARIAPNDELELHLLQAFLNQDFDQFSSDDDSEFYIKDDILLVFSKNELKYEVFQIKSNDCPSIEEILVIKLISLFSFVLLILSFLFDYTNPFKYGLDDLVQNFCDQDTDQIKYCLDSKTTSERDQSANSIRTIDSAGGIDNY